MPCKQTFKKLGLRIQFDDIDVIFACSAEHAGLKGRAHFIPQPQIINHDFTLTFPLENASQTHYKSTNSVNKGITMLKQPSMFQPQNLLKYQYFSEIGD